MNQIMVIKPYKWNGLWVFDDPAKDLDKEALVGGTDTLIDHVTKMLHIPEPEKGFICVFSKDPFPGSKLTLEWVRQDLGGNIYAWNDMEGWLCPALFKYFDAAPSKIHIDVRPVS